MEDNSVIDLKKIKRHMPAPPIEVAPLVMHAPTDLSRPAPAAPIPAAHVPAPPPLSAPAAVVSPPRVAPILPPKPKVKIRIWKFEFDLPPIKYLLIALVGAVVLAGGGYYIYVHVWTKSPFGPTTIDSSSETASVAAAAVNVDDLSETEIVNRVGKLMLLPAGEIPTLAKVSDPAALKDQPFFENAQLGDVVLMYGKSRRAIIYDPQQNKIIEVAPITDASSTAAVTPK